MIFGTDTSKFQPPGTYQPGEFEIVNAEDPSMPTKVARNVGDNRPWSLYVWVYAGEAGAHLVDRLQAGIARAGHQPNLLAGWWDFEDTGVVTSQVVDACYAARARGLETGYYSNTWRIDHRPLHDFAYWPCAYPGRNDGSFPGLGALVTPRPAQLWQYASGGGLDRDVVVDEEWYFRVTGAAPTPPPTTTQPPRGDTDMLIREDADDGTHTYFAVFERDAWELSPAMAAAYFLGTGDLANPRGVPVVPMGVLGTLSHSLRGALTFHRGDPI